MATYTSLSNKNTDKFDTNGEDESDSADDKNFDEEDCMLGAFYAMQRRRVERESAGGQVHSSAIYTTLALIMLSAVAAAIRTLYELREQNERFELESVGVIRARQCTDQLFPKVSCEPYINDMIDQCYTTGSDYHSVMAFMRPAKGSDAYGCYCCGVPPYASNESLVGKVNASWDIHSLGFQFLPRKDSKGRDVRFAIAVVLVILASVLAVIYVVVSLVTRPSISPLHFVYIGGSYIFMFWFLLMTYVEENAFVTSDYNERDDEIEFFSEGQYRIAELWFLFSVGCLICYYLGMKIFPKFVMAACDMQIGATILFGVMREDDVDGGAVYSYFPKFRACACCHRRKTFTYSGGVDGRGRPHGFGEWRDTCPTGEWLSGMWLHGQPIRTFISRETLSYSQFVQRPIGYAAHRYDCPPGRLNKQKCFVRRAPARYGVVHVECSVAGGFFKFLPKVRDEENLETADEMIKLLRNRQSSIKVHSKGRRSVEYDIPMRESALPVLAEKKQKQEVPQEALVYVHGWSADMATALTRTSLMLSLGKCQKHIVPFIFGWSSGNVASIFTMRKHSREYAPDFVAFFRELQRYFREVHVITHSMGAHLWLQNFALISHCFIPTLRRGPPHENDPRLHLATVTMMNANALVEEVAAYLPHMFNFTEHVTFYNDTTDVATLAEQVFVSSAMPRSMQTWRDQDLDSRSLNWDRYASPVSLVRGEDGECELRGHALATALKDGDLDDDDSSNGYGRSSRSRGSFGQIHSNQGLIDIIDCTNLQANAGLSRHNYYSLNPLMVEDVCELISFRRVAIHRAHLIQREGNVFDFLAAPKDVKN